MERREIIIEGKRRRCLPIIYIDAINKIINREVKNINITKQTKIYIPKGLLSLNNNNISAFLCSDPNEADYILLNTIEKETFCYMYKTKEAYLNCQYSYLEKLRNNNIITKIQSFSVSSCTVSKNKYPWLEDFEKFDRNKIYNINSFVSLFKGKFDKQELKSILEYLKSSDNDTKLLGLTLLSEKNLYDYFYDIVMFFHYNMDHFINNKVNSSIKKMYAFYHIEEWLNRRVSYGNFEQSFYESVLKHKNFINDEDKKRFSEFFSQQLYHAIYYSLATAFNTDDLNYNIKITVFDFSKTYPKDTKNLTFKQLQKTERYVERLQQLTSLYKYLNAEGKKFILDLYKKQLNNTIKNLSVNNIKIEILWEK